MMVLVLLMVPTLSTFLMVVSSMSNIMPMIMMDMLLMSLMKELLHMPTLLLTQLPMLLLTLQLLLTQWLMLLLAQLFMLLLTQLLLPTQLLMLLLTLLFSWEEARQMADAHPSAVGEPYGMKVGAASKGIIQRDFQHHATVFKSPYAKNPFDSVSNEELEEYKRIINKKNKGDSSPASPVLEEDTNGDTTDPGLRDVEVSKQHAPQPTTPSKEFIGDDDVDSQADFKAALERSLSTRQPGREGINNEFFERNTPRSKSLGRGLKGEHTNYEEETDGNRTFSEGEGDTSRATDPDSAPSPKKEKKKKGLRTPSFLKKKKKDKKEKEKA